MPNYETSIDIPHDEYVRLDGIVEAIRNVAYPRILIRFEADDEYDLAMKVKEIEDELSCMPASIRIPWPHITDRRWDDE